MTAIDKQMTDHTLGEQLEIMKQKNVKAEIEALMADSQELMDSYLPDKFARRNWIG
jgi:DNA topoisomerase VI subunit A